MNQAKTENKDAGTLLSLSLMPAFFAAGCCATTPLMLMFGISLGELSWYEYRWSFRLGGLAIFVVSLVWYFKSQGIGTMKALRQEQQKVLFISLQTALYTVLMYVLLLYAVIPTLHHTIIESVSCCGL